MPVLTTEFVRKRLGDPDEVRTFPKTRIELYRLGGQIVARILLEPGWRWLDDLGRAVNKDQCPAEHAGYLMSGRMGVRMDDGRQIELAAGDLATIPPSHQAWVIGDEQAVFLDFAAGETFSQLG